MYPVCRNMMDIEKFDGKTVILIGIYHYGTGDGRGKRFRGSMIRMEDNVDVVLSYSPPPEEWKKLDGKKVFAIGCIRKSIPEREACFQRLLLPHLTRIKCLVELEDDIYG